MQLIKGKRIIDINNGVQLTAFLNSGWMPIEEVEQQEKSTAPKKPGRRKKIQKEEVATEDIGE